MTMTWPRLLSLVLASSLIAAVGLALVPKMEPQRKGFGDRCSHFFLRAIITIGFWAMLIHWMLDQ